MLPTTPPSWLLRTLLAAAAAASVAVGQQRADAPADGQPAKGKAENANPYKLEPFHDDFPVELEYPPHDPKRYVATRRQILARLAANLQGNVRRETWQLATDFYWRAPEDAVEPLIEAMDRAMINPALGEVVRNCCEAMGKMANEEFDGALRRALQHKKDIVQQAAFAALARSGTLDTVRAMRSAYYSMDGRARVAWLQAVRTRLPLDEATGILRELTGERLPQSAQDELLVQTAHMPAKAAAEILRQRWDESLDEFRAVIAGVLHAAGDGAGTAWLRDLLESEDVMKVQWGIKHCAFGDDPNASIGVLRDLVLRATTHQHDAVRKAACVRLLAIDGDDVTDALEVLTDPDEKWEIRGLALRELTRRGRNQVVTAMLDELPTATGTRLVSLVNQLSASGDGRAVPVIVDRFRKAGEGRGRPFLQALAQNASREATAALCELFLGPEIVVADTSDRYLTTRNYLPTLLLNARGNEHVIVEAFRGLSPEQWRLRALMMPTLTGIAADRHDQPDVQSMCIAPVREVLFDRQQLPQLRVLALNFLTQKWLTIEDVLRLKNSRAEEQKGLQLLLNDYLQCYW